MLRTIFLRFKDSGIIKLFVYFGISGKGNNFGILWNKLKHALKGGDIKFSIYLHKLIFEAIIRTKIIYLQDIQDYFLLMKMHFRTLFTFRKTFKKKIFKMFVNHCRPYQS